MDAHPGPIGLPGVRLGGRSDGPCPCPRAANPLLVPCLVLRSGLGHPGVPSRGPSHSFLEKKRNEGKEKKNKIHDLVEQHRQRGAEELSQAMPRPRSRPLPGGAMTEPSCSPSGLGRGGLPPHLLPVRWGVTPTKAGAASVTLGLCPDTRRLNLFLGTSCYQGPSFVALVSSRRVSPSGQRGLICWRPPAPAYNGIKVPRRALPRSHPPSSTVTESPRSPRGRRAGMGIPARSSSGGWGIPTHGAGLEISSLLRPERHGKNTAWKCCSWGSWSGLGSRSAGAQDQDPWHRGSIPTSPPSHPCSAQRRDPRGAGGCWGTPGCPAGRGPPAMGCKEQQRAGSALGARRERSRGGGWHPRPMDVPRAPLPGQPSPQARDAQRRDSAITASLARHPSPRRPYLPLMLRSSLPKARRLGKMLRDCICSKWILSGGEQSTGEFSKRSCDHSPRERQPVPSGSTSPGTQRGPGSAPKPTGQRAGAPRLSPCGWSHSKSAGQETAAPFSPKNVLVQSLASLQPQI